MASRDRDRDVRGSVGVANETPLVVIDSSDMYFALEGTLPRLDTATYSESKKRDSIMRTRRYIIEILFYELNFRLCLLFEVEFFCAYLNDQLLLCVEVVSSWFYEKILYVFL